MKKITKVMISMLFLMLLATGCSQGTIQSNNTPSVNPTPSDTVIQTQPENTPTVSPTATNKIEKAEVTLYFGDSQYLYLVPVKKSIETSSYIEDKVEKIITLLANEPEDKNLNSVIPKESLLITPPELKDKVLTLNFNKDFQDKNPGGSTGETMAVYSVVNSVTNLDGIEKVQFLINGKIIDSLKGHMEMSHPISRNESLIKK